MSKCNSCSGHHDPLGKWDPYNIDDFCDCRNGTLRYFTQKGRKIIAKYPHNPYGGKVRADEVTADERDFNAFVAEQREIRNNESYDPIQFEGGGSTDAWLKQQKGY